MLTDEFLQNNVERLNKIVDFAAERGDDGAALGVLVLLAISDEELDFLLGDGAINDPERFALIMAREQERFQNFGICTDD